jgi:Short C-terminal domain
VTEAAAPPPAASPHHLTRGRKIAVWSLVGLATLIGLISILTIWVNRQMLDNDSFKKASAQLVRDPEIRGALSVYLVNQLYNNVDVSGQLEKQLPDNLKPLAGPVAAGLRQPATDAVAFLLSQGRVQQIWINSTALAHQQLVNVLENKTGAGIDTGNGVVTVDLSQLVKELGTQLGLPASALDRLPASTGRIEVMRSDQLGAAQTAVQVIRVASVFILILVLALYALAIYLARGRRRETLRSIGWAFVFVGLVVLVIRTVGGNYAVNALTQPVYRKPANHVWLIETSILGELGRAVIIYGIVGVLGAVLAGPTHAAIAVRRWMAPMLRERPGLSWGILGFVYLLIILWGPTHALRTLWGILFLGALIAFGFELIRRQTIREFPDATFAHAAASAKALGAKAAAMRPKGGSHGSSPADEIARLDALHKSGALTDDEFAQAKARALT